MRKIHEPHVGIMNQLKCGDIIHKNATDIGVACLNKGVICWTSDDGIKIEKINPITNETSEIRLSKEEIAELINFVT